ncbi:thioredoxin-like protein [Gonapodya prolifera JEL478]|uniref:Thioredoxin-like protein n=1 Tax=Gonapodya prolifera (strain JEL478) TaxID=1344416 RepID=A0A139A8F9_GONPJ|nr:thioredoxin-like protein [Gonapodya prolifera JEL478]|eukprot:KXS12968.1 thioredoxin-like protein [Gonapodya prolifera JEL478]
MTQDLNTGPPLRLGSVAPDFTAQTTQGDIRFHDFIDGSWVLFFSHPADFTPVCTTELGAIARLKPEFDKRGVKAIGLSCNELNDHEKWIDDIERTQNGHIWFPIVADADRKVAALYSMVDYQDPSNIDKKGIPFTVRSVFVIDPKKTIRLTLTYPASVGRNVKELLRVIDSLQTGDKHKVTTPVDWEVGQKVIIPPTVSDEAAKASYPPFDPVLPYLRFTTVPSLH